MQGMIVYNGFWNIEPPDPVCRLQAAAQARGIGLTAVPHTALTVVLDGGAAVEGLPKPRPDFVLFWDKDVRLARALEATGLPLFNSAQAVALCDDKAATQLVLEQAGLPMPRTLVAPMAYVRMEPERSEIFLRRAEAALGFPMVVKECFGSLGGQVYLARDGVELRRLTGGMQARPFVLQQFVAESAGEDVRLYVVGGQVVASMRRCAEGDAADGTIREFRSNLAGGGKAYAYTPTEEETALALRCREALGLHFAGVDLLHAATDGQRRPLVCEVNSNAFLAGITACTGIDVADAIVRHVMAYMEAKQKEKV